MILYYWCLCFKCSKAIAKKKSAWLLQHSLDSEFKSWPLLIIIYHLETDHFQKVINWFFFINLVNSDKAKAFVKSHS